MLMVVMVRGCPAGVLVMLVAGLLGGGGNQMQFGMCVAADERQREEGGQASGKDKPHPSDPRASGSSICTT